MPSWDNIKELVDNCTNEWMTYNNVNGRKFTSKTNGSSIFLPAAGEPGSGKVWGAGEYGNYWSSTQNPHYPDDYEDHAYFFGFDDSQTWWGCDDSSVLYSKWSVRPVCKN